MNHELPVTIRRECRRRLLFRRSLLRLPESCTSETQSWLPSNRSAMQITDYVDLSSTNIIHRVTSSSDDDELDEGIGMQAVVLSDLNDDDDDMDDTLH